MKIVALCIVLAAASGPLRAATYYVEGANPKAADTNPGTQAAPWKTIARAGRAKELKPGDTVLIKSGIYRECADITVSGQPGRPITFAAAPGERVVLKGSEIVRGPWSRLSAQDVPKEPFPFAFQRVWKVRLGDEFFTDPRFSGAYDDRAKRWVSQVFWEDDHPLQMIGPDAIYKPDEFTRMVNIGRGLADMIPQSFWFEPADQTLYVNISGDPAWYTIEVGVRGFALTVTSAHDVVIRGLEMRHNRQPGGQWPLASVSDCRRVVVEDCKVYWADFCGLSVHRSRECAVRRCDVSNNGAIGIALGLTEDCTVEDCALLFNNYRHFYGDWGVSAGMKNIPGNKRTTVRRCEAAYNAEAEGIWFDTDNEDIRILDNICHDNGDCGIFFEINRGGGVIAGNLVYGNHGRGIYVSGSQNTWVVHNTVVENATGIVAMTRAKDEPPKNTRVLNNLFIRNYITGDTLTRGSDLTLEMSTDADWRAAMGSASDYNVYADNTWTPFLRHNWNDNNTFSQWQERYRQDEHSRRMPVPYDRSATGFRLLAPGQLDVAGPLPNAVTRVWKPRSPKRVGANLTRWPGP
jgi:parallel beta-helix repeat protein